MSLSQYTGGLRRTTLLPHGIGPLSTGSGGFSTLGGGSTAVSSTGSLTNWTTVLNVTGTASRLNTLFFNAAATSGDFAIRVTIDGTVVLNGTRTVTGQGGYAAVGLLIFGASNSLAPQPVDSSSSLKIEFAGTVAGTVGYNYQLLA